MSPTKEMTPATLRNALSLFSIKVLKESGINDKCKKECKKSIKNRLKIFSSNCDNLKKEETKSNKKQKQKQKQKPKQKPKFPVPFCGIVEKTWCKGIKKTIIFTLNVLKHQKIIANIVKYVVIMPKTVPQVNHSMETSGIEKRHGIMH